MATIRQKHIMKIDLFLSSYLVWWLCDEPGCHGFEYY